MRSCGAIKALICFHTTSGLFYHRKLSARSKTSDLLYSIEMSLVENAIKCMVELNPDNIFYIDLERSHCYLFLTGISYTVNYFCIT